MAIQKAAVIGAGLMGGGIAAHIANAGHDVVLLDIVPDGAKRPERAGRGRRRPHAQDGPRALHGEIRRQAHHHRQYRGPPAPLERCGLDRRGGDRDGGGQAGRLPQDRFGAQRGRDRLLQHLDHSLRRSARRDAGCVRAGLPHHPLLQPAALHAALGGGGGATNPGGGRRGSLRLRRPQARQGCGALQRHARLHRQPHRHLLADRCRARSDRERGDGGGGRRGAGPPHRRAEDRHLRADRSGRTRPDAAGRAQPQGCAAGERSLPRGLRRTRVHRRDDRERLYRPQGQGRLLQAEARLREEREGGARPRHRRIRACPAPAAREHRAGGPLAPGAVRASGQDRRLRLAGDVGHARLYGRAGARDRRRCRSGRSRHAPRLRLEARAVRDDRLGRRRLVCRKARRRGQGGAAAAAGGGGRRRLLSGRRRARHASRRQRHVRAACAARRRAPPLRHQARRRSRSPATARRASGTSATALPASNSTAR